MNESEYKKIQAVRNSGLGTLLQKSPAHYLHELRQPESTTPALTFGSYFHAMILTPEQCEKEYFVLDESLRPYPEKNYQTKANQDWKAAQIAHCEAFGRTLISLEDHQRALEMKAAIRRSGLANEVTNSQGTHEKLVEWTDLETGVRCKARIDKTRNKDHIIDLKTCRDASKRAVIRSIIDYGYHRQAAFYMGGSLAKSFTFVFVESSAPYGVAVYDLSDEFLELGSASIRSALRHIKVLREKFGSEFDPETQWPSYEYWYNITETLQKPTWAVAHDFGE
jgi:hypothetical protein